MNHRIASADIPCEEIQDALFDGKTWAQIAEPWGVSGETIRRRAHKCNCVIPDADERRAKTANARAQSVRLWVDRKSEEIDQAGASAQAVRIRILQLLPRVGATAKDRDQNGEPVEPIPANEVRSLAVTYGILIDKTEMLVQGLPVGQSGLTDPDTLQSELDSLLSEWDTVVSAREQAPDPEGEARRRRDEPNTGAD